MTNHNVLFKEFLIVNGSIALILTAWIGMIFGFKYGFTSWAIVVSLLGLWSIYNPSQEMVDAI